MSHAHKVHKSTRWGDRKSAQAVRTVSPTPLDEDRFQSLLAKANAFFVQAECDVVAERAAVISEIRALMATYGLSVDDLQDLT